MPMTKALEQINRSFTYHPPKPDQQPRYAMIRDEAKALATIIAAHTPPSREQSLALTSLEQAVMWANAAIARNESE
jgi:hypothetical protein